MNYTACIIVISIACLGIAAMLVDYYIQTHRKNKK